MLLKSPLINNGGIMQIEHSEKHSVTIYGKKVYYINPLIAIREIANKNESDYIFENIDELPE